MTFHVTFVLSCYAITLSSRSVLSRERPTRRDDCSFNTASLALGGRSLPAIKATVSHGGRVMEAHRSQSQPLITFMKIGPPLDICELHEMMKYSNLEVTATRGAANDEIIQFRGDGQYRCNKWRNMPIYWWQPILAHEIIFVRNIFFCVMLSCCSFINYWVFKLVNELLQKWSYDRTIEQFYVLIVALNRLINSFVYLSAINIYVYVFCDQFERCHDLD